MDTLRSLYKANLNSPRKCKRKEANEIRANKRSELYTSSRKISSSPYSVKKHCEPSQIQKENVDPSLAAKSVCPSAKSDENLSRHKAHLLKFLAWKAQKAEKAQIKEHSKRAPFVVGTRNCAITQGSICETKKSSFAPSNHIFRAPEDVQNFELKVIDSKSVRFISGNREETYNFVATPNKKSQKFPHINSLKTVTDKSVVANFNATKLPLNHKPVINNVVKQHEPFKRNINNTLAKSKSVLPPIKRTNFKAQRNVGQSISTAMITVTGNTNKKMDATKTKLNGKSILKVLRDNGKASKQIQENPLINVVSSTTKKIFQKIPSVEPKQFTNIKVPMQNEKQKIHSGAVKVGNTPLNPGNKLVVSNRAVVLKSSEGFLKPNSDLPPIKRPNFKTLKKSNSSVSNAIKAITGNVRSANGNTKVKINHKLAQKPMPQNNQNHKSKKKNLETPTDVNQGFPFLNVVTSTKRKSLSSKELSANSLFLEMDQLVSPVDGEVKHSPEKEKFNFLRYSVVQSEETNNQQKVKPEEIQVTPERPPKPETPTTYLSPYVSVSRGKVGIKTEREKRNSVYMCVDNHTKEDADTTAKIRHILATVQYYRKQLNDEIERLKNECNTWQQYKNSHTHLLEDAGSDMINVTIGQTNLLITKKLKQFSDLIDRCEDGAVGRKSTSKGEGAKPILTEDLEGFWSMVGLQIENVDKRFANLQRWKENNWKDPDEVALKSTNINKNLGKIKKITKNKTAGPNRDLQKILRNAQAAFLRKKKGSNQTDEDIILTPSKSRQVIIKDRRSRSAAATVITVKTPKISRKSSAFDERTPTGIITDEKILPHVNEFRKSMNLFKSALLNNQEKISPIATIRKSILKTPGSVRKRKSVIFNSPRLQFTIEDKVEDETPPKIMSPSKQEKDEEEERTYSLRTRSIKLRDLADIIIPE